MMQRFMSTSMVILLVALLLNGCMHSEVVSHQQPFPLKMQKRIALYPLANYTDTPQAGLRAANLVEGVLLARGILVVSHLSLQRSKGVTAQIHDAKRQHATYLMTGGVSEWCYKTGIDGEPAVSLHLKLIDLSTGHVIWSSTGSESSWGNDSIGTTAQTLLMKMFNQ